VGGAAGTAPAAAFGVTGPCRSDASRSAYCPTSAPLGSLGRRSHYDKGAPGTAIGSISPTRGMHFAHADASARAWKIVVE
jgi:hypothetical protein